MEPWHSRALSDSFAPWGFPHRGSTVRGYMEKVSILKIEEWNALQKRIADHNENDFTPEELAEAEAGWQECVAGKGESVEDVMRELLPEDRPRLQKLMRDKSPWE